MFDNGRGREKSEGASDESAGQPSPRSHLVAIVHFTSDQIPSAPAKRPPPQESARAMRDA